MNLGLGGKKALVTGAGRGIGRAVSLSLAGEGARVAATARSAEEIGRLVEDMGGKERGHYGVALDLASKEGPERLLGELSQAKFAPVDIVVHNLGGTLGTTDPLCSVEEWRRIWRFNMETAIEINLGLIPFMQKNKWGRIVHISSISSMENQGPVPYCSVKAALTAYSRSLGRVLASQGIVVTAVLPGAVFTEKGYWDLASREKPDHVKKYLSERMAIHRFGTPEEIAPLVSFLCSEAASFCIGSVVPVDGGQGRTFFGQ